MTTSWGEVASGDARDRSTVFTWLPRVRLASIYSAVSVEIVYFAVVGAGGALLGCGQENRHHVEHTMYHVAHAMAPMLQGVVLVVLGNEISAGAHKMRCKVGFRVHNYSRVLTCYHS